jgi:molybdopterin molybdotransferase
MSCTTTQKPPLLSVEEALGKIQDVVMSLPEPCVESVTLLNSLGRVLASPVVSQFASPRFSQSAVDGYGVSLKLESNSWQVIREIQAGDFFAGQVEAGQAVRIFTGAPIPLGVDAVVMQEDTVFDTESSTVNITTQLENGENIRFAGEEYPTGEPLLPAHTVITPPILAVLASQGLDSVSVYSFPKVALMSTGNELVQPGQPLAPGQIYDSNAPALNASLRGMGFPQKQIQIFSAVSDTLEATRKAFQEAMDWADIIISLGGVSVGEYDLVQDVYTELGVEKVFWRLAAKPGKPVYFGHRERTEKQVNQLIWGLPGNPVAAMVTFYELVRPAILARLGLTSLELGFQGSESIQARLTRPLKKKAGRMEWVRGILSLAPNSKEWQVSPTSGQDSHMILGLAKANALIGFPTEATTLQEGDWVNVSPLDWFGLPEGAVER